MKIHSRAGIKILSRSKPKLFYPLIIHNPSLSAPFPTTISVLTHPLTRLSSLLQLSLPTHSSPLTLSNPLSPFTLPLSSTLSFPFTYPLSLTPSLQTLLTLSPLSLTPSPHLLTPSLPTHSLSRLSLPTHSHLSYFLQLTASLSPQPPPPSLPLTHHLTSLFPLTLFLLLTHPPLCPTLPPPPTNLLTPSLSLTLLTLALPLTYPSLKDNNKLKTFYSYSSKRKHM